MNECAACRLGFASLAAFDVHRAGRYPQKGPADRLDRRARRFVDPLEDWTPELGRRCLDADELIEAGLELDSRGRWRVRMDEMERERLAALATGVPLSASGVHAKATQA